MLKQIVSDLMLGFRHLHRSGVWEGAGKLYCQRITSPGKGYGGEISNPLRKQQLLNHTQLRRHTEQWCCDCTPDSNFYKHNKMPFVSFTVRCFT